MKVKQKPKGTMLHLVQRLVILIQAGYRAGSAKTIKSWKQLLKLRNWREGYQIFSGNI
jgi:hypothetical protein